MGREDELGARAGLKAVLLGAWRVRTEQDDFACGWIRLSPPRAALIRGHCGSVELEAAARLARVSSSDCSHAGETHQTSQDHRSADKASPRLTERNSLLEKDECRDHRDQQQVHHAADE